MASAMKKGWRPGATPIWPAACRRKLYSRKPKLADSGNHFLDTQLMTETEDLSKRHIRSFVLRQGRVSVAQQRAIDTWLPRYGILTPHGRSISTEVFGRDAPKILEIGFRHGRQHRDHRRGAIPRSITSRWKYTRRGVGNLLKLIDAQHLENIRIMQHDAVEVLRDMIADESLSGVSHLSFPTRGTRRATTSAA